jgi:organic radical activating enzyme
VKTYSVNEIFYSLQGEGVRAGTAAVFIRFAGCNLRCTRESIGFDCDTEFTECSKMTAAQIAFRVNELRGQGCDWVILTGGEPALQVDTELLDAIRTSANISIAIETNGTIALPDALALDWISVSPKPGTKLKVLWADEVRYVLAFGQKPPHPCPIQANYQTVSPEFFGAAINAQALLWCIEYVLEHPEWRLSVQQHKGWGIK